MSILDSAPIPCALMLDNRLEILARYCLYFTSSSSWSTAVRRRWPALKTPSNLRHVPESPIYSLADRRFPVGEHHMRLSFCTSPFPRDTTCTIYYQAKVARGATQTYILAWGLRLGIAGCIVTTTNTYTMVSRHSFALRRLCAYIPVVCFHACATTVNIENLILKVYSQTSSAEI
jgi:hypothetical protein